MSSPMVRTISRPFGLATAQPRQPPADDTAMPPVTDFVLSDTQDDTPHDIHPHAAAYASRSAHPMDQAPMRIPTGASGSVSARPRAATAEERAAYVRMRNARARAEAELPAQAPPAPPANAPYSPPLATYALTATAVDPSFRVPATATYQAPSAPAQDAQTPTTPRPFSLARSDASVLDPQMPPAAQEARLGSPLVLTPPQRASSLGSAARPLPPRPQGQAELEVTYTSASGRAVTVRLYAP